MLEVKFIKVLRKMTVLLISSNTCWVVVSLYPRFMQVSSAFRDLISRKMQMMDEVSKIFILSSCLIKEFLNRKPGQKCGFLQADLSFLIKRGCSRNPLSYHLLVYCRFFYEIRV